MATAFTIQITMHAGDEDALRRVMADQVPQVLAAATTPAFAGEVSLFDADGDEVVGLVADGTGETA